MNKFSVFWINAFPAKGGVSSTFSPRPLLTGMTTLILLPITAYVQTHEENYPTNSQQSRTLGAITLAPANSLQVDYYFLSLNTGARIHRPMPDHVIARDE